MTTNEQINEIKKLRKSIQARIADLTYYVGGDWSEGTLADCTDEYLAELRRDMTKAAAALEQITDLLNTTGIA